MLRRLWRLFKFEIETFLVRGPLHRLLVMAMTVGAITAAGGLLVYEYAEAFGAPADALWWAFLRLTDPGYLGDDDGMFVRVVSTVLTLLGYVVFLGALVAVMTQWLNQTLERLQSGLTPIAESNHIVILGWSGRVATIVQELLLSEERVRRFLRAHRTGSLRIAILAEEVNPALVQEMRDQLDELFDPRQIILRSGTPLRIEHLRRVDFSHAAAILLPRPESRQGAGDPDDRILKTLLSISASRDENDALPLLVAEIGDVRKAAIAERAYQGPIEAIAADRMFARLVTQTIRNPGLSAVFGELLTHRTGTEIYIRQAPELEGKRWAEVVPRYRTAVPIGIVRGGVDEPAELLPEDDVTVGKGDRIAVVAPSWRLAAPSRGKGSDPLSKTAGPPLPVPSTVGRILIIGWNEKVPAIILELARLDLERRASVEIDIVSRRSREQRVERLRSAGVPDGAIAVNHIELVARVPEDLSALEPWRYEHAVIVASDRFDEEDESDARAIVAALVLDEACRGQRQPHVIVELLDPDNEPLLRAAHREILVSPLLIGHAMAQVALRPELNNVFDVLFGSEGIGVEFHPPSVFETEGREITLRELSHRVAQRGAVLLGWKAADEVVLNPNHDCSVRLEASDRLIVLRR